MVLLTFMLTASSGKVSKAIDDVRGIIELTRGINANSEILHVLANERFEEAVANRVAEEPGSFGSYELLFEYGESNERVYATLSPPNFVLSEIADYPFQTQPQFRYSNIDSGDRITIRPPRLLGSFVSFGTATRRREGYFIFQIMRERHN